MKWFHKKEFRSVPVVEPLTPPTKNDLPPTQNDSLSLAGLSPIHCIEPDDVIIVGYPKSGNTWVQNLIAGAVYGLDLSLAPDALVQDLVPDVHVKQFYRRYRKTVFFKSHSLPHPAYRRIVYLLRDGRDVMVSYFHHLRALQGDSVDFLSMIQTGRDLFPGHWHEHIEQWQTNPHRAEILTVRYEDLKKNTASTLQQICEFSREPRSSVVLQRAVEQASFAAMQKREMESGWENSSWPKDKLFIRRGKVGSYEDEMPVAVRDAFLRQAGDTLKKLGYLH